MALETIESISCKKGLVADSLVISSGGQLPERPFEHWRTKRKNMATLFRATGKQVTAGSERDSSFQLTAITSVESPLSFRLTVCVWQYLSLAWFGRCTLRPSKTSEGITFPRAW